MEVGRLCCANLPSGEGLSAMIFTKLSLVEDKGKCKEMEVGRLCCANLPNGEGLSALIFTKVRIELGRMA